MNDYEQSKKLDSRPVEYSKLQLPDAEQAALGAILLEPTEAPGLLRKLDKSMFADLRNLKIYEAMRILNADSVELEETALIQKLKKDGEEAEVEGVGAVGLALDGVAARGGPHRASGGVRRLRGPVRLDESLQIEVGVVLR